MQAASRPRQCLITENKPQIERYTPFNVWSFQNRRTKVGRTWERFCCHDRLWSTSTSASASICVKSCLWWAYLFEVTFIQRFVSVIGLSCALVSGDRGGQEDIKEQTEQDNWNAEARPVISSFSFKLCSTHSRNSRHESVEGKVFAKVEFYSPQIITFDGAA